MPCTIAPPSALRIDTTNLLPIVSKEDYLPAQLTITDAAGVSALSSGTQVRGRGNTTWDVMPKKPYRLKLDSKAPVLGMPADKDWVLLANYADKTLLRNAVAFCLGSALEMAYVPRSQFAELTVNGEYLGLYQLVEQIKNASSRVPVVQTSEPSDTAFLLEIDARLDGSPSFVSKAEVPFVFKTEPTPEQVVAVQSYIEAFETALLGDDFADPVEGYARYLDVDAAVDYYLVNELTKNPDAFWLSAYVYKTSDGKLTFGPLWDFDLSAGNVDYNDNRLPEGYVVSPMHYMARLLEDPSFKAKLAVRWRYLSARMPDLLAFIDESALMLDGAQRKNFQRWDILSTYVWPNAVVTGSYADEVDYLKGWLATRTAWLDAQLLPEG